MRSIPSIHSHKHRHKLLHRPSPPFDRSIIQVSVANRLWNKFPQRNFSRSLGAETHETQCHHKSSCARARARTQDTAIFESMHFDKSPARTALIIPCAHRLYIEIYTAEREREEGSRVYCEGVHQSDFALALRRRSAWCAFICARLAPV